MKNELVLITGGAGFIGSHLADELLTQGYRVRVLDNLDPQVHADSWKRPDYLDPEVELILGDVRDAAAVQQALDGVDFVYHFAAAVGVGQSMYQISRYTDVNCMGTAVLLEALSQQPVKKLVVASSMSIYGEGLYRDRKHQKIEPEERREEQLLEGIFELMDEGVPLEPIPTPESKRCIPSSYYALGKYDQEKMCLICGRAYRFPVVAMRFFNVYGPRQALSNPYTGVLAIFASRLLNNQAPKIFEDGEQRRDFVHVRDVARACRLALETPSAAGRAFNVGSGRRYTINEIAASLSKVLGKSHVGTEVTGGYRVGDIRHCYADISAAREVLGYTPRIEFEAGLSDLAEWLEGQVADDLVEMASAELASRGLSR